VCGQKPYASLHSEKPVFRPLRVTILMARGNPSGRAALIIFMRLWAWRAKPASAIVPGHPLRWTSLQLPGVPLQLSQIVESPLNLKIRLGSPPALHQPPTLLKEKPAATRKETSSACVHSLAKYRHAQHSMALSPHLRNPFRSLCRPRAVNWVERQFYSLPTNDLTTA
jgi:hypothetical protein